MDANAITQRPLVAVILLCHKNERHVREALAGLFAQDYAALDLIVIDDGSPDRTGDIIEEMCGEHDDVRFVLNPFSLGREACIQVGLDMTDARFVLIRRGDDVLPPDAVSGVAKAWIEHNVSLVTTNAAYIDEESRPLHKLHLDPQQPIDTSFETLVRDGANALCFDAGIAFERDLYELFGFPPASFLGGFDIAMTFYAYLEKGVFFVEEPLLKHRAHYKAGSLPEMASEAERLRTEQRIRNDHIANAVYFLEKIDQLKSDDLARYGAAAERIMPLLRIQIVEQAKKLVRCREDLFALEQEDAELVPLG